MTSFFHRAALVAAACATLVLAGCGGGDASSNAGTVPPPATPQEPGDPAAPQFAAFGTSARTASLAWPAAAGSYAVERRSTGTAWAAVATVDAASGGWVDEGLAANTTYEYRLKTAQGSSLGLRSVTTSSETGIVTAAGAAQGVEATQTIGSAGGQAGAGDVSVVIPAGALADGSAATVQPVANAAPDGRGAGLRVRLSGKPQKALSLTVMYDAANDNEADGLRIAVQRSDGAWFSLPLDARDAATRTLKATLPPELLAAPAAQVGMKSASEATVSVEFHVVKYLAFYLSPQLARVKVKNTVKFVPYAHVRGWETEIGTCERFEGGIEACIYTPMLETREIPFLNTKAGYERLWQVFTTTGGDAVHGTIAPQGDVGAVYTAPAQVPNPSQVLVRFYSRNTGSGAIKILTAGVDVYDDDWSGTMTAVDGPSSAGTTLTSVAHVTWKLDTAASQGGVQVYRGIGTVDVQVTDDDCTASIDPSSQPISTDVRLVELQVDEAANTFKARLITSWTATISGFCPKASASQGTRIAGWGWEVEGGLSADGRTIEGSDVTEDGYALSWSFRR